MKFEVIKPEYKILKVIPATSARNNETYKIAQAIQSTYKPLISRFTFENYKEVLSFEVPQLIRFEAPCKTAFFIYITKKQVDFYFIVAEKQKSILKEAIGRAWGSVTVLDAEKLPSFSDKAIYKQLVYAKEDALSLEVDRRDNELLNNNLNIIDVLQDSDRTGIFYNFIPTSQHLWRAAYKNTINKYESGAPIDRNKVNITYVAKSIFNEAYSLINLFNTSGQVNTPKQKELSHKTQLKASAAILNTQIALISESNRRIESLNNIKSLANSFRSIDDDNYLKEKAFKIFNHGALNIGAEVNKMSIKECGNFIALAGRELLERYHIEHINTLETVIPEELLQGYINLGAATYKGNRVRATMSADPNLANLGLCVLGAQRAGKSTFFANYAHDVIRKGESLIVIDFVKNCELSADIERVTPSNKLISIDLSEASQRQSFAFNEVNSYNAKDKYELLEIANMQTQLMLAFLNAINPDMPLTSRMRRGLASAGNVVFINKNMSLRNVIECLSDYRKRAEYISLIPAELVEYLQDDIYNLKDMDEYDKRSGEIIDTKTSKIEYAMDRINLLTEDIKLKLMFNKTMDENINFAEEISRGKVILIKIPEDKFPTQAHKNILATFFISKIWLASQLRGGRATKPNRCHVILDEIFQAPTAEFLLKDILVQAGKFQLKFIFSAHYLSQIDTIREALKASGASYMLLQSTDKKNYEELKEDLQPYELQDLLNLKRYHSLNLIKATTGFEKFITELPNPI
jgi:hypothetical protein